MEMMKLSELPGGAAVHGDGNTTVNSVSLDSRTVEPGGLYAALPGANAHGAQFAQQALDRGAAAILTNPAGRDLLPASAGDIPVLTHPAPRAILGDIAAAIYGTDPQTPSLFGITGTNGKTTSTFILDALLRSIGRTTGLIGTVATVIAGQEQPSVRTTPEAPDLHRLFKNMRDQGADACSMEVSSHALSQHRVDGAHFTVAGFTNLSRDHLDFHGTMEEYYRAKALLFTPQFASRGVIVLADDWARQLVNDSQIPVVTVSARPEDNADYRIEDIDGLSFTLRGSSVSLRAKSPLPGDFNISNTALALAMLLESGVSADELATAAEGFSVNVPGRMEVVSEQAPRAIVDYSHTPDAIEKALAGLSGQPLVVVCGAGGERDHSKRPLMGRAAAENADVVIITDDNPRSEDPATIRAEVIAGARAAVAEGTSRAAADAIVEYASRREAIEAGVAAAGESGTVLVAGKGHEPGQDYGDTKLPFDDREITRTAVSQRGSSAATR